MVRLLHSPDTIVHLVSLLEDMPVTETLEAIEQLREKGLPVGAVIINAATQAQLPEPALTAAARGELAEPELADGLRAAGLDPTPDLLAGLREQAAEHAIRVLDEQQCREQLAAAGLPMLELPRLVEGGDLGGVYELADRLAEQGVS